MEYSQIFQKKFLLVLIFVLSSNKESQKIFRKIRSKKIKFLGNLKFSQSENEKIKISKNLKKFILSKTIWCASSTHNN